MVGRVDLRKKLITQLRKNPRKRFGLLAGRVRSKLVEVEEECLKAKKLLFRYSTAGKPDWVIWKIQSLRELLSKYGDEDIITGVDLLIVFNKAREILYEFDNAWDEYEFERKFYNFTEEQERAMWWCRVTVDNFVGKLLDPEYYRVF